MKNVILPENNIVTAWVEVRYFSTDVLKIILWFKGEVSHLKSFILFQGVGLKSMRICVRDLSGTGRKHDPLSVSYIVTGGK